MIGRGGSKNVGNRLKYGNDTRYRNVGERIPVQNECNNNTTRHINQVENDDERTQMHDANIQSSENSFENESEGKFSPNIEASQLGKRKRANKLNGRINMAMQATEDAEPPIRREGDDRNVNRHQQNEGARNNGFGHLVANGDNAPNTEGCMEK
ncbi:hypothetical protein BVRB_2g039830 [Beta vulgaris subsp. vulgaris]|nr:hypothetical protein BVRB_2g039830 [Beta vulgaris subsp. vulgaris]